MRLKSRDQDLIKVRLDIFREITPLLNDLHADDQCHRSASPPANPPNGSLTRLYETTSV
jgi:hypothetical protein